MDLQIYFCLFLLFETLHWCPRIRKPVWIRNLDRIRIQGCRAYIGRLIPKVWKQKTWVQSGSVTPEIIVILNISKNIYLSKKSWDPQFYHIQHQSPDLKLNSSRRSGLEPHLLNAAAELWPCPRCSISLQPVNMGKLFNHVRTGKVGHEFKIDLLISKW